ncbi:MAG: type II secretion system F family protein [Planctomycetota bacterium]|nr:type II secretion system F family protein [Planctomycetota bacterium]
MKRLRIVLNDYQQIIGLALATSVFGLVLSLWIGGVLLWARKRALRTKKMEQRLNVAPSQPSQKRVLHLWHEGRKVTTTVPVLARPLSWLQWLESECRRAGWHIEGKLLLLLVGGTAILTSTFLLVVSGNVPLSLGVVVALLFVLRIYLKQRISRQDALFDRQFVDALGLAARSLRSGHPLIGTFHLVSEEMAPPVSTVFADICQQHSMGAELEVVLRNAAEKHTSTDMKLFATSVAVQMRTGGNLADLMDRLAVVVRDRIRLGRRMRILSAQTQMSKRVLLVLPFIVFILFNILNPDYMAPLYTTNVGNILLAISALGLAIGSWIMNRMAVLKY